MTAMTKRGRPAGTLYTKGDALNALAIIDEALETEAGFLLAQELNQVAPLYAALIVLQDYVRNSTPIVLAKAAPDRWEIYAQQVGARAS